MDTLCARTVGGRNGWRMGRREVVCAKEGGRRREGGWKEEGRRWHVQEGKEFDSTSGGTSMNMRKEDKTIE